MQASSTPSYSDYKYNKKFHPATALGITHNEKYSVYKVKYMQAYPTPSYSD